MFCLHVQLQTFRTQTAAHKTKQMAGAECLVSVKSEIPESRYREYQADSFILSMRYIRNTQQPQSQLDTKLMSICVIFQTSYPAWAQSVPVKPVTSWDLEQVFLWACHLVTAPPSIKHGPYLTLGLCRLLEQIHKLQENSTPGETVTTFENESPCPRSSERCNETPKLAAPETDWLYLYKLNLEFLVTCVF